MPPVIEMWLIRSCCHVLFVEEAGVLFAWERIGTDYQTWRILMARFEIETKRAPGEATQWQSGLQFVPSENNALLFAPRVVFRLR